MIPEKINIISFSGGKDSTALILWAKENLPSFEVVFCDTGWEDPITYDFIKYISENVAPVITIKSKKYDGFVDMAVKRQRFPSSTRRFCTEHLKLVPMQHYIHEYHGGNVNMYVGIRADESLKRSLMKPEEFDGDWYGCMVYRPLLRWSVNDVFAIHKRHGIVPNPLYKQGMKRVGCMPCIMSSLGEIKTIINHRPDVIEKLIDAEAQVGRSFFPPGYIPDRFCSKRDEQGNIWPTVRDVVKYVQDDPDQIKMFDSEEPRSCMSVYNICE